MNNVRSSNLYFNKFCNELSKQFFSVSIVNTNLWQTFKYLFRWRNQQLLNKKAIQTDLDKGDS